MVRERYEESPSPGLDDCRRPVSTHPDAGDLLLARATRRNLRVVPLIQLHVVSDKVRLAELGLPQGEPRYIFPTTAGPVHFPPANAQDRCGILESWAPRAGGVDTSTAMRITLPGMRERPA